MLCPKCGRRLFKKVSFCPKCGAPISAEAQGTESDVNLNQQQENYAAESEMRQTSSERPPYAPAEQPDNVPNYNPTELPKSPVEEVPPSVFVPEIEFKPVNQPVANPSDDGALHNETSEIPNFYGSYGEACNSAVKQDTQSNPEDLEFTPVFSANAPTEKALEQNEWKMPKEPELSFPDDSAERKTEFDEDEPFNPILPDDDDELILPDFSDRFDQNEKDIKQKSIGYEDTVKLENVRKSYKNEAPINQPIHSEAPAEGVVPKIKEFTAIASSTARVKGDLPPLKENQIYVAITPKEFRQLKSRKLRGLGIVCTLCLVIIASFCIWNYANSFSDPLVGRWKGDVKPSDIPIAAIQQLDQDILNSTWEFSSGGSMYLNIIVNDTPINLSGSYTQQHDENGEQYLSMTINNPMDGSAYTFNMYYTVTGRILEFNDMEGLNMIIDLTRE